MSWAYRFSQTNMESFQNLVSVIIPCFNHADFLKETIESVQKSTYPHFEVIIVNDGSTDQSEDISKEMCNEYDNVKYLYQANQGPSAARNNGIKLSKGKYILPLDADDLISNDYIINAVRTLDNNDDVKLVYCLAEFFGEKVGKWNLPEFSRKYLARENMIFSTAMYRKSDWEITGGYDERMKWGWEDWEYWIALLKDGGNVVRLPLTGFFYRVRSGSRRKSTNREAKRKTIDLINEKHKTFIIDQLYGPLHYNRSWSAFLNKTLKWFKR